MMAVGTKAGLLKNQPLQSYLKHQLLDNYVPVFVNSLTKGTQHPVVLVDGYAGNGRYADGTPGSAEVLLKEALNVPAASVALVEKDPKHHKELTAVVNEYRDRRSGDWIDLYLIDNRKALPRILEKAARSHLFLFLDPCGAGLPFDELVKLLRLRRQYPRTEVMLNFSGGLVRRTGARVLRDGLDCPSLDAVCGSDWWRPIAQSAHDKVGSWEEALGEVVTQYAQRLTKATGHSVVTVPVKRTVTGQTMFFMVCTTLDPYGFYSLSDATAKAISAWLNEPARREDDDQGALFEAATFRRPVERSKRQFRKNLLAALERSSPVDMVDDSEQLLRGIVGELTVGELGAEARDMEKQGLIRIERRGRGGLRNYRFHPA